MLAELCVGTVAVAVAATVYQVSPRQGPILRGAALAGAIGAALLAVAVPGAALLTQPGAAALAALAALALALAVPVARGGAQRAGLGLALVVGAGLGHDWAFRLGIALPVCALLVRRLRAGERWVLGAPLMLLAGFGLAHGWLPRAVTPPATPPSAQAVEHALGLLSLLAALAGIVAWLRARAWWPLGLVFAMGGVSLALTVWGERLGLPAGSAAVGIGVPLALALAVLAGAGIAHAPRRLGIAAPAAAAALAVMIAVQPLWVAAAERPGYGKIPRSR